MNASFEIASNKYEFFFLLCCHKNLFGRENEIKSLEITKFRGFSERQSD